MTKKVKQKILYFLPVLIAGIFIAMALAPVSSGGASQIQPTTTTATTINETMPYLNTNVTWSAFNSTMTPNEYLNGTDSPNYINAEPSVFYKNYISINPADIRTHLKYPSYANTSEAGVEGSLGYGAPPSTANSTYTFTRTTNDVYYNATSNNNAAFSYGIGFTIDFSDMPSSTLAYDWITMQYTVSGTSIIGETAQATQTNNNGNTAAMQQLNGTGSGIISYSLEQAYDADHALSEANYSAHIVEPMIILNMPATTSSETVSLELTGMYITTYAVSLGTNATGSTANGGVNSIHLSNFQPDISNVSIVNDGYSEALSQPMSMGLNYTYTQAQITGSQYIEENTRETNLEFPTGSDISYSNSNISLVLNGISGSQIGIYNINGVSYSSSVSTMHGNQTLYSGSVNPNQPNNVIIQTEYTAQQWNSITQAPFFLSIQGIEYYWWIFLIGTFGAIGIFAGLKSYSEGKEENLRAPPKVR